MFKKRTKYYVEKSFSAIITFLVKAKKTIFIIIVSYNFVLYILVYKSTYVKRKKIVALSLSFMDSTETPVTELGNQSQSNQIVVMLEE